MNVIKRILSGTKYSLNRENDFISADLSAIKVEQDEDFVSDHIVNIAVDGYLDATSKTNIAKYKSNLKILIEEAKKKGRIDDFRIIRNDNFFPDDWKWRVSSKNTGIEKRGTYLTTEIRRSLAYNSKEQNPSNKLFGIQAPILNEELFELLKNIDEDAGFIMMPTRYRSTKHFTINTPLAYTGDYNQVTLERNFHVIDKIDNFLNSGYAYSADYVDAYLDVSHEALSISDTAVVLISKDKYEKIVKNTNIRNQLNERKVIIFEGDESVAINMVLTEMGVLPYRPGKYVSYDAIIIDMLEKSMRDMCQQHNIGYHLSHGNIDEKGGHFSDLYDKKNPEQFIYEEMFINFLRKKFPGYSDLITYDLFKNNSATYRITQNIPIDNLLEAINEFNEYLQKDLEERYPKYKEDRDSMTEEEHLIFKNTIKLIIDFFNSNQILSIPLEERIVIDNLLKQFYHSDTKEEQLLAARELSEKLSVYSEQTTYKNTR